MFQQELKEALRSAQDLYEHGLIPQSDVSKYEDLLKKYEFLLPRYYASLIDRDDPNCPIRLQAVPSLREMDRNGDLLPDPLGDLTHKPAPRVTHRYRNRALLHMTASCSMYCRFCFRKTLLNEDAGLFLEGDFREAIDYLAEHAEIEEVILSGGDPLMVSDQILYTVLSRLAEIPHLERVRLHTRVPVTLPSRVTPELTAKLSNLKKPLVTVVHFNHPKELTALSRAAVNRLRAVGTVLNQSVLLRGVNDRPETLIELSKVLFEIGILPYYLHHPDRASGTGHFHLSKDEGLSIWNRMRKELPGYLVPRYVVDEGDGEFKRSVESTV